jgi:hypothetical protein
MRGGDGCWVLGLIAGWAPINVVRLYWRIMRRGSKKYRARDADGRLDTHEVIDVVANEVLATVGPLPAARAVQERPRLFPGSHEGYMLRSGALGDRQAVIVEYSLVAR